tara:strand:- start:1465 stop:2352 length:888 start_codon:yes stop_codon:yes gene_type:complete
MVVEEFKNKSMNVAICISGEPRYLDICAKSLANAKVYCQNHDINLDIFYHLWDNITLRQKSIDKAPIIESFNYEKIQDILKTKPTIGIVESKDILDPEIEYIYNYINSIIIEEQNKKDKNLVSIYNMSRNIDNLKYQIKNSNHPPYSQLSGLCKSQMLRIEYEEKQNIKYDVVIRTRTDVQFSFPRRIEKLKNDIEKQSERKPKPIYFPHMWSNGTVGVEYCFIVGSSFSLKREIFENYKKDIPEILFRIKNNGNLFTTTSHDFVPTLIHKYSSLLVRCGTMGFKQRISQMEKLF